MNLIHTKIFTDPDPDFKNDTIISQHTSFISRHTGIHIYPLHIGVPRFTPLDEIFCTYILMLSHQISREMSKHFTCTQARDILQASVELRNESPQHPTPPQGGIRFLIFPLTCPFPHLFGCLMYASTFTSSTCLLIYSFTY